MIKRTTILLWRKSRLSASLAVVAVALGACGGGGGSDGSGLAEKGTRAYSPARLLPPESFAAAVSRPGATVINVHVPYEGEIPGTDAFLPFDRIARRRADLPPRSSRLVIYCRTGRMSVTAARTLWNLGYRDIVDLRGGMVAWKASGRPLRDRRD